MDKYFVKLSTGCYSSYSPDYYMGNIKISKKELDKKGIEVGDKLIEEFELLPTRPVKIVYSFDKGFESYNEKGEAVYQPDYEEWKPIMEKWLFEEKGYIKLDDSKIPEINIEYSDLPNSKNKTF